MQEGGVVFLLLRKPLFLGAADVIAESVVRGLSPTEPDVCPRRRNRLFGGLEVAEVGVYLQFTDPKPVQMRPLDLIHGKHRVGAKQGVLHLDLLAPVVAFELCDPLEEDHLAAPPAGRNVARAGLHVGREALPLVECPEELGLETLAELVEVEQQDVDAGIAAVGNDVRGQPGVGMPNPRASPRSHLPGLQVLHYGGRDLLSDLPGRSPVHGFGTTDWLVSATGGTGNRGECRLAGI